MSDAVFLYCSGGWRMYPREWVHSGGPRSYGSFTYLTYNLLNDYFMRYVSRLQYGKWCFMRYRFKLLHTINDVCPPFNTKVVLIYGDQETRIKLAWQKRKHCKVQHLICTLQCFLFCQTNYRPQRSWAKVIFSQVCVKNSVHRGGGCLPQCMLGYTPQ